MNRSNLQYKTKTASRQAIINHLQECADYFIPPLYTYVNINNYAEKIYSESMTFESWDGSNLIGLIAAYFNDEKSGVGYITNISVIKQYQSHGIASQLLKTTIDYGKVNNFTRLMLEIRNTNKRILKLYNKFGFVIAKQNTDTITISVNLPPDITT